MSDSEFDVLDSVQTVDKLQQELDEANATAERRKEELAATNRNHQHIVNDLELRRFDDAAQAVRLRLEVEEDACFQAITTAAKMHLEHHQLLQAAKRDFRDEIDETSRLLADDEKHAHETAKKDIHQYQAAKRSRFVFMTFVVLGLLFVFVFYEMTAYTATNSSLSDSTDQLDNCRAELQIKTKEVTEEKAAHTATKASLDSLRAACDTDKYSMYNAMVFLLGKEMSEATIKLANDIIYAVKYLTYDVWVGLLGCGKKVDEAAIKVENNGLCMTADELYNLASKMTDDEIVTINGNSPTKKELYINALEIDPLFGMAWNKLGILLSTDETVTINDNPYTKKECFIKALEIGPL